MASSLDAPWLTGAWSTTALALCMASHERLGESSPLRLVASHADLLRCIMRFIELIVPDDAPLLAAAIARAAPGQRILLRRGEHHIDCGAALQPLSALPLAIRGEVGAVVRGTLVLGAGGGSIHGVRFDDAGGDCLRCVGGQWLLARLRLRCSHGCALRLSGGAQVTLERCTLGGESEQEMGTSVVMLSAYGSVQEAGIRKTACYALVLRNKARLRCTACTLSHCSEAALLLAENSRALLSDTLIDGAPAAFVAGSWPGGRALELAEGCRIRRVKRLWVDGDRPRLHVMSGDTAFVECFGEDEDEAAASLRSLHAAQREVRGDGESTTSTGSLEEQGYANIEALMEELDDMALSQAAAGSDAVQSS
mmetsp:Transcript_45364/g.141847  ORF Transcript_45364/g.141847 Transcript_45364/m.141847 type:complete len:366 (-) Transcript_45364:63-1160(-)